MYDVVAHTTTGLLHPWVVIGWGGSIAMLLIGLVGAANYYKADQFPDVDKSPETETTN